MRRPSGCTGTITNTTRCWCSPARTPKTPEIYLDIKGERHIITTSGTVYIPAGTKHCPLGFNRVDRPFRFLAIAHYLPASEREQD